ncbi:MAG: matrixin family metalloprotease [Candidatus Sulfopaludibacter sp.]|nr:matrixin family metalloprotease [Candidatus Sulfopaludibacter sp.]
MSLKYAICLILLSQCAWAGDLIRLKSRTIDGAQDGLRRETPPSGKYWLVQFQEYPGARLRAELVRRGFRIIGYVPDSSLLLEAPKMADLSGLGARWTGPLDAADKLSKGLNDENSGTYLVEFHRGVNPRVARGIVRQHGFLVHETEGLIPWHLLVTGGHSALRDLAGHEEVAYIMRADPELLARKRVAGCGGPITEAGPVADYALADTGWLRDAQGNAALQYIFATMTQKLDANVARSQVERAFSEWARYTNLTFTPAQQTGAARTIDILFANGAHGDAYPFTSITSLAHTFYPAPPNPEPVAGDMHFNDAQTWGVGMNIDLFSVALHEIGHALGLAHSDAPSAVMYPYYKLSSGLTNDDIAAIQALYGTRGAQTGASDPPPPPTPPAQPTQPAPPAAPTPPTDTVAPTVAISAPAYTIVSTTNTSIAVSGTAKDNVGVTAVKWATSTGNSGTASGTSAWSATVPLLVGTNTITVRAYDAAGNSGWRSVTVVRH